MLFWLVLPSVFPRPTQSTSAQSVMVCFPSNAFVSALIDIFEQTSNILPLLADILNYALTLEHLEASFYQEGLQNYTQADFVNAGYMDPFYANLMEVASDEQTHVSFLTQALTGEANLQ